MANPDAREECSYVGWVVTVTVRNFHFYPPRLSLPIAETYCLYPRYDSYENIEVKS